MAAGRPCRKNKLRRTLRTSSALSESRRVTASTFRLNPSRTVSGSHRSRFRARHQPLISIVHRSFGPCTSTRGRSSTLQTRTRGRCPLSLPSRWRTRATVLLLGASSPSERRSTRAILSGPQVWCWSRSSRMRTTISSPVVSGLESGRRLCSTRPVYPCARKRRSHLWPVCREMPYSLQSAEMFAPIALAFSMYCSSWLMTRCSFQGTRQSSSRNCQRCPEPVLVSDVLVQHLAPFAFPRLGRHSELDYLLDGQVSTQPSASASCQPFCLKSLRRLACSTCSGDHVPLLLKPFSLPSLPHSLHLQTFPHQDSIYEAPF